jgi:predicted SAM-dependent methyltransferase
VTEYLFQFFYDKDQINKEINDKYPGWYIVKCEVFNIQSYIKYKEWLENPTNITGKYEMIDWLSLTELTQYIIFENEIDMLCFNLTFIKE